MDKDTVEGTLNQASGAVKDIAGKVTGDQKLQAEGFVDNLMGKAQAAIGDVKQALDHRYDYIAESPTLTALTETTKRHPLGVLAATAALVFLATRALSSRPVYRR